MKGRSFREKSRRVWRVLSVFLLAFWLFAVGVGAQGDAPAREDSAAVREQLLARLEAILPHGWQAQDTALSERVSLRAWVGEIVGALRGQSAEIGRFAALCFGSALLGALASVGGTDERLWYVCRCAVCGVCSFALVRSLCSAVETARETIGQLTSFFTALSPVMGAVSLAGGATCVGASGAAFASASFLIIDWVLTWCLMPVSAVLFALGLLSALGAQVGVDELAERVRSVFLWILGLCATLFAAALTFQSVLSAAADDTAQRAVRYAASGMIPLVGGAVSGALSTLMGSLSYVRSVVGVGGAAALLSLGLPFLVRLFAYRLCLDGACLFARFCGSSDRSLPALRGALDCLIGVCVFCLMLYFLQTVLFLKWGVPAS